MNLEDELRSAMRRGDPPSGFAGRVAARVQAAGQTNTSRFPWFRIPQVAWVGAAAAMLVIGLVTQAEYRRIRAERAG